MPPPIFTHDHRVSYSECTVGNHVYYSRYLDILEEARGELFRAVGAPLLQLQAAGIMFPVIECRLRYRAAARYDDLLRIEVWPTELGSVRLTLAYQVNREPNLLILDGTIQYVCTSLAEKPRRIPSVLADSLRPFLRAEATP